MPAPGESLFLPDDTAAVLEWQQEQRLICGGCGQPSDESMVEDGVHDYEPRVFECLACAAKERKQKALARQEGGEGFQVYVERVRKET